MDLVPEPIERYSEQHTTPPEPLLVELAQIPDIHADAHYAAALPTLVRTALALRQPELASRLLYGVEPRTPQKSSLTRGSRGDDPR